MRPTVEHSPALANGRQAHPREICTNRPHTFNVWGLLMQIMMLTPGVD